MAPQRYQVDFWKTAYRYSETSYSMSRNHFFLTAHNYLASLKKLPRHAVTSQEKDMIQRLEQMLKSWVVVEPIPSGSEVRDEKTNAATIHYITKPTTRSAVIQPVSARPTDGKWVQKHLLTALKEGKQRSLLKKKEELIKTHRE